MPSPRAFAAEPPRFRSLQPRHFGFAFTMLVCRLLRRRRRLSIGSMNAAAARCRLCLLPAE